MSEIVEIIQPSGQLDFNNLVLLKEEITTFLSQGVRLILLDLQNVTNIESQNIAKLKNILDTVRSYQGEFYVCSLNEQIQTAFEITNTACIFKPLANQKEFEEKVLARN